MTASRTAWSVTAKGTAKRTFRLADKRPDAGSWLPFEQCWQADRYWWDRGFQYHELGHCSNGRRLKPFLWYFVSQWFENPNSIPYEKHLARMSLCLLISFTGRKKRRPKRPGASVITQRILSGAQFGAIILSHDIHQQTVDAMPATLDALLAKGYKLVTVSELIAMNHP
jgi:peptidoglycan/xylan/chitin deacetylase (PgdA/CDA1 family)